MYVGIFLLIFAGCVFLTGLYAYTTWNTGNHTPTILTSSDYVEDYEDAIVSVVDT